MALTTNPGFVDAFMVGLNAQVVAELRFRNHPLIPGWTPVRTFWDRVNLATGASTTTSSTSAPGRPTRRSVRQPPDAVGLERRPRPPLHHPALPRVPRDARLPGARTAQRRRTINWSDDPDFNARQFPTFQGRISPDLVFFGFDLDPHLGAERWVVLEETVTVDASSTPGPTERGDQRCRSRRARPSARRAGS